MFVLITQGDLPAKKTMGRWRAYWPVVRDLIAEGWTLAVQAQSDGTEHPDAHG